MFSNFSNVEANNEVMKWLLGYDIYVLISTSVTVIVDI